jgi:hypothetical protein
VGDGSLTKQLSTASQTEYRKVALMALADHRPLDDYDAEDGPEPTTYGQATNMPDAIGWQSAVNREQESLEKNKVYEIVKLKDIPRDLRCLTSRWGFKRKLGYDGTGEGQSSFLMKR